MKTNLTFSGLKNQKLLAIDTSDQDLLKESNHSLAKLKRSLILKAKAITDESNPYAVYLKENRKKYGEELALNDTVLTVDDAISLLMTIDFRKIIGIKKDLEEDFLSPLFVEREYSMGFAYSEEQAVKNVEKIKKDLSVDWEQSLTWDEKLRIWRYNVFRVVDKKISFISYHKEKGTYQYAVREEEGPIFFNIIEIYEISMQIDNQYRAIRELCNLFHISISYIKEQGAIYDDNIHCLQTNITSESYPHLANVLTRYRYFEELLKLNHFGKEKIISETHDYHNRNVFFLANSNFFDALGISSNDNHSSSKGAANAKLNLYCVLGLLEKVPRKDVPPSFKGKIVQKNKRPSNYYIIPSYTNQILIEAERRAMLLLQSGISPSKLTGALVLKIFGREIYIKVYGNYYNL